MKREGRRLYRTLAGVLAALLMFQGTGSGVRAENIKYDYAALDEGAATVTDAGYEDGILTYPGDVEETVASVHEIPVSAQADVDLTSELSSDLAPELSSESESALQASYISPWATGVRNQKNNGICWAFAACGAAEAEINKEYHETVDLSEWQLAYFTSNKTVTDPLGGTTGDSFTTTDYLKKGGEQRMALRTLAAWRGFVPEEEAPYETVLEQPTAELSETLAYDADTYHLEEASIVRGSDINDIKQLIMEYGAGAGSYYSDLDTSDSKYYNMKKSDMYNSNALVAEYCDTEYATNHAITIVGWDDDFSADNFGSVKPKNNGAWYVKNSWGEEFGQEGYFWISYEDINFQNSNIYFYDMISVDDDYTYNYQYDGGLTGGVWSPAAEDAAAYEVNVYTVKSDETLRAVGFFTEDTNYDCQVSIYIGDYTEGRLSEEQAAAVVNEYETYAGYHTLALSEEIPLKAGTTFSVVVKQTSCNGNAVKISLDSPVKSDWYTNVSYAEEGQSFIGTNLANLTDAGVKYTANCRIKAFTDAYEFPPDDADDTDGNKEKPDDTAAQTPSNNGGSQNTVNQTPSNNGGSQNTATQTPSGSGGKQDTVNQTNSNSVSQNKTEEQVPSVTVSYRTHIQGIGWEQTYSTNGSMAGTTGQSKRLEAIQISVSGNDKLGIQYVTHCQTYGWMSWNADNEVSGTSGESKRMEAIEIQLTGEDKDKYDVYYRVHAQNYGWLGWAKNGAPAGTAGLSKRLEGIQIIVVKKSENIDKNYGGIVSSQVLPYISNGTSQTSISGADSVHVAYQTHVQSYGWQNWKYDGTLAGTTGESKRLEGINIKLTNKDYSGGICYTTHIQGYGWQDDVNASSLWKRDGEMSGTSGQSRRLEAIRIKLTGEMAEHYDVYYRVHAQSYGWLGWAKNGEPAGTAGYSKRLEGIEIVLVQKGGNPPGSTLDSFRQK